MGIGKGKGKENHIFLAYHENYEYFFDSNYNIPYKLGDIVESNHAMRYLCTYYMWNGGHTYYVALLYPRVGDFITCINKDFCVTLTVGKRYEVISSEYNLGIKSKNPPKTTIGLIGDNGELITYHGKRFGIDDIDIRKNKINKFLRYK